MSVLKYFKDTPVAHGRQDPNVIFFLEFTKRSLAREEGLSPPRGDRVLPPI